MDDPVSKRIAVLNIVTPSMAPTTDIRVEEVEDSEPCAVCSGQIVEETIVEETHRTVKTAAFGMYCRDCGIMYRFRPRVRPRHAR